MADNKVTSQLTNMVKFIEKEATEKAQEIRDKTQSEYTIEKSKIVIAQKEKITTEINRKQQQVLVDKRMYPP
jgi:vacuolar-type H+-ATPase subunit E/Vma4